MFKGYGGGRPPPPPAAPRPALPALPSAVRPGSQQQKFQPDPTAGEQCHNRLLRAQPQHHHQQPQPAVDGAAFTHGRLFGDSLPSRGLFAARTTQLASHPGVIRTTGPGIVPRRRHSEHLSPEEEERRRLRRERNKLAAAKCRNRRKELTDTLQAETEQLEAEQSGLQKEIAELQKQKDRLELVLEAHRPVCKILEESSGDEDGARRRPAAPSQPPDKPDSPPGPRRGSRRTAPVPPTISLPPSGLLEPESLHTPDPHVHPVFHPLHPQPGLHLPGAGGPRRALGVRLPLRALLLRHRRSSSGDHSSDSLNSPTLLAL